jgi:uncharacterized protein (DUF2384 family)
MRIDDILNLEEFKGLEEYLHDRMLQTAGPGLVDRINDVLGSGNAIDWYYSPLQALSGKRPYDYCKAGQLSVVETLLGRIEYGVYS